MGGSLDLVGRLPQAYAAPSCCSLHSGQRHGRHHYPAHPVLARLQPRHNAAQYQARQYSEHVKQQLLDAQGMADFLQSACSR